MAQSAEIRLPRPLSGVQVAGRAGGTPAAPVAQKAPAAEAASVAAQKQLEAERTRLATARAALEQAGQQFRQLQEQFIANAEAQIAELALEVARKVLMQEVQAGRYEIDPIVREALSRIPSRTEVVVHLNGDDLARCKLVAQQTETTGAGSIRFIADSKVPPAGCLLQTTQGTVESSVDEHLGQIAEALGGTE